MGDGITTSSITFTVPFGISSCVTLINSSVIACTTSADNNLSEFLYLVSNI